MSGIDKIKERILEEARLQADTNIKKSSEEAAAIIEAAEKEAENKKRDIIEKAKKEALDVKKRLMAVAELEARKERLKAKQEVIEEAFEKALEKLKSLPDNEFNSIMSQMIVNSVKSGNEEIIVSPSDKTKITQGFIDDINKKISLKGIPSNIKLSDETRNILGGFVLKSGDIEVNNSFEAIIRMNRDEIEPDVIKSLF